MSKIEWTDEELTEFDRAIDQSESRDQMERISGRLAISRIIRTHGQEKCDAMWAELQRRDKQ